MITSVAPARVGILGNPSDGYGGRTMALAVEAFSATVQLEPIDTDEIVLVPDPADLSRWRDGDDFVDRIDRFGYGTGTQLLAAAVRTFIDVCESVEHRRPEGFELHYRSTIPRQVGMAGSSALVVAAMRCLGEFVDLEIPEVVLPSIALRVETEQLGITAGLQDRVVQTYGGLMSMDFGSMEVDGRFGVAHGSYEREDAAALPPLFCAYRASAAEPSGNYHSVLRARFEAGDSLVRDTMRALAGLVVEGRAALRWKAEDRFGELIRENMRLRRGLGSLPESQLELVDLADSLDAPSTFTGSGGAVVGAYRDSGHLAELMAAYASVDAACLPIN
jgi:glucuronokinase